ncbi:unnamed protein product, partial [Ectocarpus sp. 12 AP-2014]
MVARVSPEYSVHQGKRKITLLMVEKKLTNDQFDCSHAKNRSGERTNTQGDITAARSTTRISTKQSKTIWRCLCSPPHAAPRRASMALSKQTAPKWLDDIISGL